MITEKELAEYRALCNTLDSLYGKLLKRKQELRKILEEAAARRRETLLFLARANRMTRHLTGSQRHSAGFTYNLCDIKTRINLLSPVLFKNSIEDTELTNSVQAGIIRGDFNSSLELRQMAVSAIALIDRIKKQLLQLDLLELRCRELISSINKAMEAFRHEARIIHRNIYPFGVFSLLRRSLRSLAGSPYFSYRDMNHVSALGNFTGLVLKIADSPLI